MSAFLHEPIDRLSLESMDGSVVIPLDNTTGWIRMPGATGLEMAPVEVISKRIPGVPGAVVSDVRVSERPIFIPVYGRSTGGRTSYLQMMDRLYSLIDPTTGSFKLVGTTTRGSRELVVTYEGGLEGADGADERGLSWVKAGLKLTAYDPFPRARTVRTLEFRATSDAAPFLGVVGGTDAPWPRMLSSTSVVGQGMEVRVGSEVPVYPDLTLVGGLESFAGTLSPVVTNPDGSQRAVTDQAWSVSIPDGVPPGSTLRMVTDPRYRSTRMDGDLAAGRIARGSTLRPFYPGLNVLDVVAPGGSESSRVILSWTERYRSLW